MFDLFRSRDKAVRILLGVLLGLVAVSMVGYLIPQTGAADAGGTDMLARIGDQKVTTLDAQQALSAAMQGRQVPPELMAFYAPTLVEQLIDERAMAYESQRLGIQVSDDEVNAAVRTQLPPGLIKKDGSIDQDTLGQLLAQRNHTVGEFIDDTRRRIAVQKLRQLATGSIIVAKGDVEAEYKHRNEKVKVDYVLIKPAMLEKQVEASPAELQDYYNKNKNIFQTPEERNAVLVVLDSAKLEQSVNPTEADLRSVYNSSLDRFRTPERVKVRHILLKTHAEKHDDAQVEARAQDLLKQIRAGGDFAELAKKNSEDTASAVRGGELDWISRGQTVKPFEDSAFSLKPGETSNLVKTIYGFHILQVEQKESAGVKQFAEVKDTLAAEYKKRKANEMMQSLADKIAADLKKDPAHPEKAAIDNSAQLVRVQNLKGGDPFPEIGVNAELHTALNGLKPNEVAPPVTVTGNKVVIAQLTGVVPAHPSPFETVKSQVEASVRQRKLNDLLGKKANELAAKAKAEGNDLAKAAKEMDFEVKTSNDVDRQGAIEGLGSARSIDQSFTSPVGALVGPIPAGDGRAVCKVVAHTPADMAQFASQETPIRNELKDKIARDRMALFEAGVRKHLEDDGKLKINKENLNRLLQSLRS